jgi:hypothetical protein
MTGQLLINGGRVSSAAAGLTGPLLRVKAAAEQVVVEVNGSLKTIVLRPQGLAELH